MILHLSALLLSTACARLRSQLSVLACYAMQERAERNASNSWRHFLMEVKSIFIFILHHVVCDHSSVSSLVERCVSKFWCHIITESTFYKLRCVLCHVLAFLVDDGPAPVGLIVVDSIYSLAMAAQWIILIITFTRVKDFSMFFRLTSSSRSRSSGGSSNSSSDSSKKRDNNQSSVHRCVCSSRIILLHELCPVWD